MKMGSERISCEHASNASSRILCAPSAAMRKQKKLWEVTILVDHARDGLREEFGAVLAHG